MATTYDGPTHECVNTCFFEDTIYYQGEHYTFPSGKKLPKHFRPLKKATAKASPKKTEETQQ